MVMRLVDIDESNWLECIRKKVTEKQVEYIASNAVSLAQSKYQPKWITKGIYDGNTMVGFTMYAHHPAEEEGYLCRFMIDHRYQEKGYGKAAMNMVLDVFKNEFKAKKGKLSVVPENDVAIKLYESTGFERTGIIEEDEEVMVVSL
ncbi:GNAT family N-acetyltransferase [Evansella cellulosilytica]|uniref:GCN5-related N-acetyltransferase n=1 Tax=Evansella cellulosilytica (strain ATCC 21833 / DSM 2522 / FERM P-1141 / JCM 9156 / N-4) TaxID=649639 RepID=E6TQB7_EVAC2|nr:GNAT family N-acetyltransferase [Evansella cellulosilytica]ADU29295.1 GCN5-related N-acetyltransferase [Evansella cellulosilytica DSM 2522]